MNRSVAPHVFSACLLGAVVALAAPMFASRKAAQPVQQLTTQPAEFTGVERLLLTADLNESPVRFLGLDGGDLAILVADTPITIPAGAWFALYPAAPAESVAPAAPLLRLTDGQSLLGTPVQSPDPEALAWQVTGLDALLVPLEQVRAVCLLPCEPGVTADVRDIIRTRNGDRLEGFITQIGDGVSIEVGEQILSLDFESVASVLLANPQAPAPGAMFWLADGRIIRAREIGPTKGVRLTLRPDWPGIDHSDANVLSIRLDEPVAILADAARFLPLASCEIIAQAPVGRRWAPPAEIDAPGPARLADVHLPGPMRIDFALPANAARFAAAVELAPGSRLWGDCELIALALDARGNERELGRIRVRGAAPEARLNVNLSGVRTLRLRLEPGEGGPIQDRIVLRRGVILLDK